MILMFAVDENWNIGVDGGMLTHIKQDLGRFREFTEGNIIIMGRRTLEALPNGQPLPNRINIVLSSQDLDLGEAYQARSLEDLDRILEKINPNGEKKVFVTGGQKVVDQLLDRCNQAYITKILKAFERADTSLHNLDQDEEWIEQAESQIYREKGLEFKYVEYRRK